MSRHTDYEWTPSLGTPLTRFRSVPPDQYRRNYWARFWTELPEEFRAVVRARAVREWSLCSTMVREVWPEVWTTYELWREKTILDDRRRSRSMARARQRALLEG